MKNLSLIAAIAQNYAIGNKNKLLYWLPNDLKRFKALTTGHTLIMGRKTFETFPNGALPNRRNIVLSRQLNLCLKGAEIYSSLEEALAHCDTEEEIYIIGGASIYKQTIERANKIYLTLIENTPKEADAYFPCIDTKEWKEISREAHLADEKHPYSYIFINYERREEI